MKYIHTLLLIAMLQACGSDLVCTLDIKPGVTIQVYEEESSEPICGFSLELIDGEYIESYDSPDLSPCQSFEFQGAMERTGTYQFVISKAGYQTYASEEFTVRSDDCHVITREFQVRLKKI